MDDGCRVLCTADVHVGRGPSRVGNNDTRHASCASMIGHLVDLALAQNVDVVALAGDIVDRENRFFEAYGPLQRALRRLAEAGIDVVAVSGNHDFDVLPRLAADLHSERFHLLGANGRWEHRIIHRRGRPSLNVCGWSFPAQCVTDDPLRSFAAPASNGLPTLALLHGDLNQPGSSYAPISLADLQSHGVSFWLLGHIHAPRHECRTACPAVLYPGSPQAMDPGETGVHGPWLLELGPGQSSSPRARQIPLSRVRYERITIHLDGVQSPQRLMSELALRTRKHVEDLRGEIGPADLCSCRLVLRGRTPLHREIRRLAAEAEEQLRFSVGNVAVVVDRVYVETQADVDLAHLKLQSGTIGELARLILALQSESVSSELGDLVVRAGERASDIAAARPYLNLPAERCAPPSEQDLRQAMLRQANLLLDSLLSQKPSSHLVDDEPGAVALADAPTVDRPPADTNLFLAAREAT